MALAALAGACTGTESISDPGTTGPVELDDVRLVAFDSCDGLLDWFHAEASARVGPYGLEGGGMDMFTADESAMARQAGGESASDNASTSFAAPSSGAGSDGGTSTTNTQETGIGEPDLTWTDGTRLVTVVNGSLQVVDLTAGTVTATVELGGEGSGAAPIGLMVEGEHAVVLQQGWSTGTGASDGDSSSGVGDDLYRGAGTSQTLLTRVDLGAEPAVVGEVVVDGGYVDARMVGGVVRTVVRTSPAELGWVYPSGGSEASASRAEAANREIVAESAIGDWLPSMAVTTGDTTSERRSAVDCSAVEHPATFGGFDVVTVIGLDLAGGAVEPLPSAAVVAGAGTVYASSDHLYVTTTRYPQVGAFTEGPEGPQAPDTTTQDTTTPDTITPGTSGTTDPVDAIQTDVHAFALPVDAAARYQASGSVPGQLLDQFALSEHEGDLRVATTTTPAWGGRGPMTTDDAEQASTTRVDVSESRVTVLRPSGGELTWVGEVTGLGPTEQIRGVRFAGPLAYVVTFRQTDPLYVVDLHDPTDPRTAGELKIPGYSSYLQDLGEGRVLGLGQDATDTGRVKGFQESLFDVADPARPERLANLVVPDAVSLAESDHHAVLWWAPERLLAVPVSSWGLQEGGARASNVVLVTRVTDGAVEQVGSISHPPVVGRGGTSPSCPPNAFCTQPIEPGPGGPGGSPEILRTVVADGRLVTVSTAGVKVSDMATLADLSWIPLA